METVVHLFQVASQCHQNGDLNRAETIYHQILEIQPENADAYHLLGIVSYQKATLLMPFALFAKQLLLIL